MKNDYKDAIDAYGEACVEAAYPRLPSVENAISKRVALERLFEQRDRIISDLRDDLRHAQKWSSDTTYD